jgi:hypothetical protein
MNHCSGGMSPCSRRLRLAPGTAAAAAAGAGAGVFGPVGVCWVSVSKGRLLNLQ